MTVDQCSLDAYFNTATMRGGQRAQVYDYIRTHAQQSSADIARALQMQRTSVTGRLREMEQNGIIRKGGRKQDSTTNITVNWYEVIL